MICIQYIVLAVHMHWYEEEREHVKSSAFLQARHEAPEDILSQLGDNSSEGVHREEFKKSGDYIK